MRKIKALPKPAALFCAYTLVSWDNLFISGSKLTAQLGRTGIRV